MSTTASTPPFKPLRPKAHSQRSATKRRMIASESKARTGSVSRQTKAETDSISTNSSHLQTDQPESIPAWKRLLDITISSSVLLILAPAIALIALYIKLVSSGPVLFKQARIGHGGRNFTCLKFRTMKVGACTAGHQCYFKDLMKSEKPMTKLDAKGDSRIIPMGWILRATGLDELPQLFNVLLGDMSMVGPRPSIPSEFQNFTDYQKQRCNTLPGLTGLWQVSGKNNTTFKEMIDLDVKYSESKNLFLDLQIMVKTPLALASQLKQTWMARIQTSGIAPENEPAELKA